MVYEVWDKGVLISQHKNLKLAKSNAKRLRKKRKISNDYVIREFKTRSSKKEYGKKIKRRK